VLIRPKRSTLTSRSDVDISRELTFRHAKDRYQGIPVIAANMDTVGTTEMAQALQGYGLSTALHKHYGVDELVRFFEGLERKSAAFLSIGITKADEDKVRRVMEAAGGPGNPQVRYLCVDVANGYHENFVTFVAKMRAAYPERRTHPLWRRHRQGGHRPGLGMHHAQDDRCRVSATVGGDRMRGCGARLGRPHLRRRRLHHARRRGEGVWWRCRLRDAGRHVCRAR
jgi:hypothetical protein